MNTKVENQFLRRLKAYPNRCFKAYDGAIIEGFEYFKTNAYKSKPDAVKSRPLKLIKEQPIRACFRLGKHLIKVFPSILRNIKLNYKAMDPYLDSLEKGDGVDFTPTAQYASFPNEDIWQALVEYAWSTHKVIVGFTEVPRALIFKGKAIPFKYALVFAQEMKKAPIEKAPELDAGMEVVNTYNSLGIATNDIVKWLRENYGIIGMANHPLGGLVDYAPLAEKAGLGVIGRHGMVITQAFGPRCRISPIFIGEKIFEFTDTSEHDWIHSFCSKCGSCVKSCPNKAIYNSPIALRTASGENDKVRYESYDKERCFTSFASTMGCGVCIRVCPFSKNPEIYHKMKTKYGVALKI